MKNFKINERVVCVGTFGKIIGKSPDIGETVTVRGFYQEDNDSDIYIDLYEYCYDFDYFEQCFIIDKFEKIVPKSLICDASELMLNN
jgi:hypothetical protein